jgi:hypothetical protein
MPRRDVGSVCDPPRNSKWVTIRIPHLRSEIWGTRSSSPSDAVVLCAHRGGLEASHQVGAHVWQSGRGEEEMAAGNEGIGKPPDEMTLLLGLEEEDQADGHDRVEGPVEEGGVEDGFATDRCAGQVLLKRCHHDGDASTPKTSSPSSSKTAVMGKPGPQPRSITLLPCDSAFAHRRTSGTPMASAWVLRLPRIASHWAEIAS